MIDDNVWRQRERLILLVKERKGMERKGKETESLAMKSE